MMTEDLANSFDDGDRFARPRTVRDALLSEWIDVKRQVDYLRAKHDEGRGTSFHTQDRFHSLQLSGVISDLSIEQGEGRFIAADHSVKRHMLPNGEQKALGRCRPSQQSLVLPFDGRAVVFEAHIVPLRDLERRVEADSDVVQTHGVYVSLMGATMACGTLCPDRIAYQVIATSQ